jgi:hypothetical protein
MKAPRVGTPVCHVSTLSLKTGWPVLVVGDDPIDLCLKVAIMTDGTTLAAASPGQVADAHRSYLTVLSVRRLHQETFRQRVLRPCAIRPAPLVVASHIVSLTAAAGNGTTPGGWRARPRL